MKKFRFSYQFDLCPLYVKGFEIEAETEEEAQNMFFKDFEECETLQDVIDRFGGDLSTIKLDWIIGGNDSYEITEVE